MKKFLIELLAGTISSAIAAWLIGSAFWQFLWKYQITDRDPVFAGVFIGMPLGCLLAIFFVRKVIYKIKPFKLRKLRLLASILVSWFMGVLGLCLGDFFGWIVLLLVLPMSISLSIILLMWEKNEKVS